MVMSCVITVNSEQGELKVSGTFFTLFFPLPNTTQTRNPFLYKYYFFSA